MLCKGWCGVPPQLFLQATASHCTLSGGCWRKIQTPHPQTEPPPSAILISGPVVAWPWMSQLTPLPSIEAVWVDWVIFWFVPDQLS